MTTYPGHCTVRKGQSPFFGQHQEIPDDPEKNLDGLQPNWPVSPGDTPIVQI